MIIVLEDPPSRSRKILIIVIFIGMLAISSGLGFLTKAESKKYPYRQITSTDIPHINTVQDNSILPISNPTIRTEGERRFKKIKMIVTAYSSDPLQTDNTPFITASGDMVRDGIVANNLLPFGTKIKIPEIYGNKIFIVKDRMNRKKSYYQVDIWFPNNWQARNFGVKKTYVEILES